MAGRRRDVGAQYKRTFVVYPALRGASGQRELSLPGLSFFCPCPACRSCRAARVRHSRQLRHPAGWWVWDILVGLRLGNRLGPSKRVLLSTWTAPGLPPHSRPACMPASPSCMLAWRLLSLGLPLLGPAVTLLPHPPCRRASGRMPTWRGTSSERAQSRCVRRHALGKGSRAVLCRAPRRCAAVTPPERALFFRHPRYPPCLPASPSLF